MKVYPAIRAVMADLSKEGIGKDQQNRTQGWRFRGIDDVYSALAPSMAKHGLCMLPRVLSRETTERPTKGGGTVFHTILRVAYDLTSTEDGSSKEIIVEGEAMDSGDKSASKAMSVAFKYAAFQAFCIPVEGESPDPDAETHEIAKRPPAPTTSPPVRPPAPKKPTTTPDAWAKSLMARMEAINTEEGMAELAFDKAVVAGRKKIAETRPELDTLIKDSERAMFERVGAAA
jgi:hypothetical protein